MTQLNLDDPRKHTDSNLEALQTWVDQIMAGSISLDDDDEPEPKVAPPKTTNKKGKKEL